MPVIRRRSDPGGRRTATTGEYGSDGDARAVQFEVFGESNKEKLDSFFTKEYLRAFDDRIEKVTGLTLNLK